MAHRVETTHGDEATQGEENMELVKKMIMDGRLAAIRSALEKDHAAVCLLLLNMGKGRWGEVKKYVRSHNGTISDGTFRSRMIEFESLGLAEGKRLDPLKKYYVKTELGAKVAGHLLEFLTGVSEVVEKENTPALLAALR